MSLDAAITTAVLLVMVAGLLWGRLSPTAGVVGAALVLYVLGVTTASEAFAGFANTAPITIAGLYVVAGAIEKTGAIEPLVGRLLATPGSQRRDLTRLLLPSAAASAFLANTPIVAMLTSQVTRWSDSHDKAASKYLIPLSYATILGGSLTVIGTSTNLVVSALLEEEGRGELSLFELTKVAGPAAVVGLIVIIVLSPKLLPERPRPRDVELGRSFTTSMIVETDGPLDGVTVEQAKLRNLQGVFLVEVVRGDRMIAPVRPTQTIRGGDRLVFAGRVDDVVDLHSRSGLMVTEKAIAGVSDEAYEATFFEVVLGPNSPVVGHTPAEVDFRARYQAAVMAIHRSGEHVNEKLGSVRLKAGDMLLVVADRDFNYRERDAGEFLLVSKLDSKADPSTPLAPFALLALVAVVTLPVIGVLDITRSTLLASLVLVAGGVLSPREARESVDLNVILMIGGAFGLGAAVNASGLGSSIANRVMDAFGWAGSAGTIVGLIISTMVLTELITNAAAVALMFPIAIQVADQSDLDPRLLMIGIAVAGSASFLTPIGYQTNTMVFGPGGYKFTDYLRLGLPLSAITISMITGAVIMLN